MIYTKVSFLDNLLDVFKYEDTVPKKIFNINNRIITTDIFSEKVINPLGLWIPQESLLIIEGRSKAEKYTLYFYEKLYNQGIAVFCNFS